MFKLGEIVYHDILYFKDGTKDNKKNRPCIVIYNNSEKEYVITVPITSTIQSFNKKKENYSFIPHVIYSEKKLNFVKLDNIIKNNYKNTHTTGMIIDKNTLLSILNKALKIKSNKKFNELLTNIIENINYEEIKQEKAKKLEKMHKKTIKKKC